MDSRNVLGVRIDLTNFRAALEKARNFLGSQKPHKIFTPNPEMLVKAQKDNYFKDVLNRSDLNLCDGFGLHFFSGAPRVTGIDFMIELCRLASEQGRGIYLLGSGSDDVVNKTADALKKMFPKLIIAGCDQGPEIIENKTTGMVLDRLDNQNAIEKVNQNNPDILFVAFGMGKQEKWIDKYLLQLPSVKIAVGVGGAFDFISGKISRAPLFLRKIGLEWLYRLFREPRRIGRIFNATFMFFALIIKDKFI